MTDLDPSKPLESASQEQFCINIASGILPGAAYNAVPGYRAKNPHVGASKLLTKANIHARVAYLRGKICTKAIVDVAYVVASLKNVASRCQQAEAVLDSDGEPVGTYKFDASGANSALDKLMKHLGGYAVDNEQRQLSLYLEVGRSEE